MSAVEYRRATAAQGGLLIVSDVEDVAFGDRVRIRDHLGRKRNGQVIRSAERETLIQVFEGTDDLDLDNTWVCFLDQPLTLTVSPGLLGRIFNGIGEPRDGRGAL